MSAGQFNRTNGIGDSSQSLASSLIKVAIDPTQLNVTIAAHPVMRAILAEDAGLGNVIGALGLQVSFVDLGTGKAASTSEGNAPSLSTMTITNVTLTPARKAHGMSATDWGRSISQQLLSGDIAPDVYAALAYNALRVYINTLVNEIVSLASSATNSIGASGKALTWSDLFDGSIDMKARGGVGGSGLVLVLLDAKGVKDLANDALASGGAIALSPQMQQFLNGGVSGGYIGRFLGAFDIYLCPELDTDSGDKLGIGFTEEGVHTKHQQVPLPMEAISLVDAGFYTVEMYRGAGTGATTFYTTFHLAVGIRQQQGIVKIIYVAT